ncbi:MAG: UDP-N-acetylglucosamine 1-carboxyvinyltransferase [candidate division Zixibacteria bacterium]|nr:UDP-N-acetylglucosamine 1-carboxyvinyltransferase [candidate division Zixibacteria bacterium]
MDKFIINGGKRLEGTVPIPGSKNSVLPILAGTILASSGKCIIDNVPDLRDIDFMLKVLETLGVEVKYDKENRSVETSAKNVTNHKAPYDLVRKMRASFLIMGPLLGRFGEAEVSQPGGCVLGARPVNLHIKGFEALGAEIVDDGGYFKAHAEKLIGSDVYFDRPSHTGTENIMLAAALAEGKTRIINAACDPEVVDVALFMNKMGAKIEGAGSTIIEIEGVSELAGCQYAAMPDRLVIGTFACMAAITGGELLLKNANESDIKLPLMKLKKMGVKIKVVDEGIWVSSDGNLNGCEITTYPYPGFPTDLQSCFMALCSVSKGTTNIVETVFENRMGHTMELNRLGANINVSGDRAVINGVETLKGASVMASDIRAGAALVTAGLRAIGTTEILRVYHIDRGYEKIDVRLRSIGADIRRVSE